MAIACEAAGLSTCCLSNVREVMEDVRPPRAVFVKWPYSSPLGAPGLADQQRRIVRDMLEAVRGLTTPGTLIDLGYRWRREDWASLPGLML